MIGKSDNIAFFLFIIIFYVSFSSIYSITAEPQDSLNSPSLKNYFFRSNENLNNNFILINEKLDEFNKFLDNLFNLNIYNFVEKTLQAELTKKKINYFEDNKLDSSILSEIKSNQIGKSNTTANNDKKAPLANNDKKAPVVNNDKKAPVANNDKKPPVANNDKKAPLANDDKKPPVANNDKKAPVANNDKKAPLANNDKKAPVANNKTISVSDPNNKTISVSEVKLNNKTNNTAEKSSLPSLSNSIVTPNNKEKETVSTSSSDTGLKKQLEESKSSLNKIKYSNGDIKDKITSIIDILKDLDEKQSKLIIELKMNLAEANKESNRNFDMVKEKTDKIENELEKQKKNAIDIKILYKQSENLSKRINNADSKSREISNALSGLTNEFTKVKYKIISDKIDSDNKMVAINKKLSQQLRIMYTTQILDSQKQAEVIQNKLGELNSKVKLIKARLPENNNVCFLLSNCGSCTSNPTCGWCSMSQECVPGSKNGPSNGQCTFFDYGSCGGPRECGSYNNCGVNLLLFIYF